MSAVLADTSVWITALRRQDPASVERQAGAESVLWLSAVVVEELYAGARGKDRNVVEAVEAGFTASGRILVPDLTEWKEAGLLLAAVGVHFGYEQIGRNRLTNDALLAVTACRRNLTLLTANPRDFGRLAQLLPLDWKLLTE